MKLIVKAITAIVLLILIIVGYTAYTFFYYKGEIIGIKKTYTYHRDNCQFVKKASFGDLIFFDNLVDTVPKYRPCKTCLPPNNSKEIAAYKSKAEAEKVQAEIDMQKEIQDIKNKKALGEYITPRQRRLIGENDSLTKDEIEWLKGNSDSYDHISDIKDFGDISWLDEYFVNKALEEGYAR
jgi:hypothetical protein